MRIGGVNTGSVHTSQSHHVTECVHDHQHSKDSNGGMDALSFSAEKSETMRFSQNGEGQAGQDMPSLSERLRRLIAHGRKLAGRLWNGSEEETALSENALQDGKSVVPSVDDGMTKEATGATSQVGHSIMTDRMGVINPQQASMEGKTGADSLWQRFKIKVYTATGHLAKRFGQNTFLQTGLKKEQGGRGESFRRQGRKHKGQEEINGIPVDRSYLMDSYDKNGKYVRLGGSDSIREYHKRDGK